MGEHLWKMWLFSVWLRAIQPFCLALVIEVPPKKISCQAVLSKAVLDSYFQPSENHGSQVSTLRKHVLLPHPSYNINQGQGTIEIGTLWICNKRDPPSEVHRTKIVNGPSSTDMTFFVFPISPSHSASVFSGCSHLGQQYVIFSAFSI